MLTSFTNRLTAYFAALLVASLAVVFLVAYFGVPALGIRGPRNQSIDASLNLLSLRSELEKNLLLAELQERRGDLFLFAETTHPEKWLQQDPSAAQAALAHAYAQLQIAHPNRFSNIFLVDTAQKKFLAANELKNQTAPSAYFTEFAAFTELTRRFSALNKQDVIPWHDPSQPAESPRLAITLALPDPAMVARSAEKNTVQLIGLLNLQAFYKEHFEQNFHRLDADEINLLLVDDQVPMNQFLQTPQEKAFRLDPQLMKKISAQKEGMVSAVTDGQGRDFFAVRRTVNIDSNRVWHMLTLTPQERILSGSANNTQILMLIAGWVSIAALCMVWFTTRRLTRPLQNLTEIATQLGQGKLTVRAQTLRGPSSEIAILSTAFNQMADAIEHTQKNLENIVQARTRELERSEARHLTLFNSAPIAVCVLAAQTIIDCNPAAVILFGAKERSDLLRHHPSDLSPTHQANGQASIDAANERIQIAQEQGHHAFEWLHRRLDTGQLFNAEVILNRVELDGQHLIQGTVRDISERKRVEAALYASEERHRTLVEWSPEGINVHRDGRVTYVNASAIRMLAARSAEELIGLPIAAILHPNFHAIFKDRVRNINDHRGKDTVYEVQFVRLDQVVIDVVAQGVLIDFDAKAAVYVAWRDVTERKRHAESQRIAATAFESQEGMFVTDADWEILRVNHSCNTMTDYTIDELLHQRLPILSRQLKENETLERIAQSIAERGSWQGEILALKKNAHEFPAYMNISSVKNEDGHITHFVGTFNDITLRKKAEDEIRHLAFYDALTGLPNRRLLMDRLEQAMAACNRHVRQGALLFIDLDNFKTLNDTLGHDQGDLLLQQVAQRLLHCTRESDTVARLGGDEFVVMLENLDQHSLEAGTQAEVVAHKILLELNQAYALGTTEHHSSPSIGITLFGDKSEHISEPLKRADLAMYQAKSAGRNTLRFFDPKIQILVAQRAELEEDLRDAMLKDQFHLHYQAQLKDDGKLMGAEVLIRWKHPKRGAVSPAEFIPLSEETGLISILGYWVLHTAATRLATWADQPELANLSIAVNVSPSQFHQKNFVEQVLGVLEMTGANPYRLKLELTEGFSISNIEDVILKMSKLKARGVGFSLDDFGTGYSSLSYLKRLPLDQLKIDQSFVRDILIDPNDAAISKMVIVLAESLGLQVIAEGVETLAQQQFLEQQGCHAYQGYLYSKPLPVEQFEEFAHKIASQVRQK